MSLLKGSVAGLKLEWEKMPSGSTGQGVVQVDGKSVTVRWKRDESGVWLETPTGVFGFDLAMELSDDGLRSYRITERRGPHVWESLSFVRAGEALAATAAGTAKKAYRVKAPMPGKIIRVLVDKGTLVEKGQPLVVMEAMKMENEIKALQAGKVSSIKITQGQAVESGAELLTIE